LQCIGLQNPQAALPDDDAYAIPTDGDMSFINHSLKKIN
jgi:hypothetical protein